MHGYLPRVGDEHLAFLDVRGAEIHQNIDHEKKVYDKVSVEKRVGFGITTSNSLEKIRR